MRMTNPVWYKGNSSIFTGFEDRLYHYWNYDEASAPFVDSMAIQNLSTINNTTQQAGFIPNINSNPSVFQGYCRGYSGSQLLYSNTPLSFGTEDFTLSIMFNPTLLPTSNNLIGILLTGGTTLGGTDTVGYPNANGMGITLNGPNVLGNPTNTSAYLRFGTTQQFFNTSTGKYTIASTSIYYAINSSFINVWHNAMLIKQSNVIKLYIDNVLIGMNETVDYLGYPSSYNLSSTYKTSIGGAYASWIPAPNPGSVNFSFYTGSIDDIAIWKNRAFVPAEVNSFYNDGYYYFYDKISGTFKDSKLYKA